LFSDRISSETGAARDAARRAQKMRLETIAVHAGAEGMLSFLVRGIREDALRVASRMNLFVNATSLGGVESLIEHRASSEGKVSNAPGNMLRLSVGLEHPDDLIDDLLQALA